MVVAVTKELAQPDGAALRYTPAEWRAFIAGVKAGEFDLA
jgi:ABC-type amino acid transport substrate-binding protein